MGKHRKWVAWTVPAVLLVVAAICFWPWRPIVGVALLPFSHRPPSPLSATIEGLIPRSWGWAWRLRDRLRGPVRVITIKAQIVEYGSAADGQAVVWNTLQKLPSATNAFGFSVWQLSDEQLQKLSQNLKDLPDDAVVAATVQTASDVPSALGMTRPYLMGGVTNDVGLTFLCYPHVNEDTVDLYAHILRTVLSADRSQIETNIAIAVHGALTNGSGLFLLQTNSTKMRAIVISMGLDPRPRR